MCKTECRVIGWSTGSLCNTAVPAKNVQVPSALAVSPPGCIHTGAILHPWTACTARGCRWNQPRASADRFQDNDSCNPELPGGGCVWVTIAGEGEVGMGSVNESFLSFNPQTSLSLSTFVHFNIIWYDQVAFTMHSHILCIVARHCWYKRQQNFTNVSHLFCLSNHSYS